MLSPQTLQGLNMQMPLMLMQLNVYRIKSHDWVASLTQKINCMIPAYVHWFGITLVAFTCPIMRMCKANGSRWMKMQDVLLALFQWWETSIFHSGPLWFRFLQSFSDTFWNKLKQLFLPVSLLQKKEAKWERGLNCLASLQPNMMYEVSKHVPSDFLLQAFRWWSNNSQNVSVKIKLSVKHSRQMSSFGKKQRPEVSKPNYSDPSWNLHWERILEQNWKSKLELLFLGKNEAFSVDKYVRIVMTVGTQKKNYHWMVPPPSFYKNL